MVDSYISLSYEQFVDEKTDQVKLCIKVTAIKTETSKHTAGCGDRKFSKLQQQPVHHASFSDPSVIIQ